MPKTYTFDELHQANEYFKHPEKDGFALVSEMLPIIAHFAQNMEEISKPNSSVVLVTRYPYDYVLDMGADIIESFRVSSGDCYTPASEFYDCIIEENDKRRISLLPTFRRK